MQAYPQILSKEGNIQCGSSPVADIVSDFVAGHQIFLFFKIA